MSYYTDANASYVQSEANRLQMINIINNKFYLHKSFDVQSDMEFLPLIGNSGGFSSPSARPQFVGQAPTSQPEYLGGYGDYAARGGPQVHTYGARPQPMAPPGLDRDDGSDWVVNGSQNDKGW